jgi:hypothetical protein
MMMGWGENKFTVIICWINLGVKIQKKCDPFSQTLILPLKFGVNDF